MSRTLLVVFVIASMFASSFCFNEEDNSLLLTELDFHQAIKQHDYLLVNFHALWCRYSKKLKPEWNNLADALKKNNSPVKLAKVEAYDEKKLAEEYDIEGFPTIKMFIKGEVHPYNGERLQSHLQEFVDRKLKNPLSKIENSEKVQKLLFEYEWIGLYNGNDEAPVREVAYEMGDILFATGSDSSLKKDYNLNSGSFVLVNNITKGKTEFSGDLNTKALREFINNNKFPAVPRFSKGTAERIFLSEEPSMILIREAGSQGDSAESAFNEAQPQLNQKVFTMAVAKYEEEIGRLLAENLGVEKKDLPTVRLVKPDMEKIKKWGFSGTVTKDSVVKLYEDFKERKATRYYISEPIPAENKDLVYKLVANTFKKEVLDAKKDVLVMFWAPWCGHCRAMMPVYDNVARKTRNMDNFMVAKLDASVNEMDQFGIDIVEYPTILLFKIGSKTDPIEFKGERNEFVFNDFIRNHATGPFEKMKGPNPFDKNEL